jgi:DNA-binding SARP family transcriptional activator
MRKIMMYEADLCIYTLGTFTVSTDDKVIETFLTRKTALLLVYLAMHPGAHARETLAPLLWSETTDAQALKNLRTVLSDLRKNTPHAITITRQSVQINDGVWIDASQFEQQCETFFTSGQMTHEEMLALVDLYCSDFLHNVPIRQADGLETWVDHQRDRLQKMYEQLLYRVVEHCVTTGDAYTGVTLARRLVMVNPLWEAAQRQLMQLLMQLDQPGEAQMQYKRLVDLLDEELGTTPAPETVDLYEQIKSGTFQSNGNAPTSGRIVLPDVPYVAPEISATALRDLLDKPDCRLVTLTGISGTGKSTLATFYRLRTPRFV